MCLSTVASCLLPSLPLDKFAKDGTQDNDEEIESLQIKSQNDRSSHRDPRPRIHPRGRQIPKLWRPNRRDLID